MLKRKDLKQKFMNPILDVLKLMHNLYFILIKLSIYIIIMNKKIVIFLILCLILVARNMPEH